MKLIVILCLLLGFAISLPAAAEKRVALVIGNANYKAAGELPNDLNDAKDMADVLRGYGFKVIPKMDADLTTTLKALDELGDELKGGGVGLFYYSGHGLEVDGEQYIVPVDAHLTSKTELPYRMIAVERILKKIGESKSQLNVVILDACRNNPYAKALGIKSFSKGFSQIQNAPSGTLIASATAVGDTSSASGARNSVYTAHLLQYLREKPNDEIRLLLGDVGTAVKTATGNDQVPWVSGSIDGRFYFVPDVAVSAARQPAPQITAPKPPPSLDEKPTPIVHVPVREKSAIVTPEPPVRTFTPAQASPSTPESIPAASDGWKSIDRYQVKEGLVKDTVTELMWMRCSIGQKWDGATCQGMVKTDTWLHTLKIPNDFIYAGYRDWRVPTIKELSTLLYCSTMRPKAWLDEGDGYCFGDNTTPMIVKDAFPRTSAGFFWSSVPERSGSYGFVSFSDGRKDYSDQYQYDVNLPSLKFAVRLVRTGK